MTHVFTLASQTWRGLVASFVALALLVSVAMPALAAETAGQKSTRNIILGAAVAAVGLILYNNYQHKRYAANTVVGYTRDGGVIYADGRIVYPDGVVLYPSNNGRQVCDWDDDGDAPRCGPHVMAFNPRGHAYGLYKHHKHHDDDNSQGDENRGRGDD
jgi:hypothetical protein